MYDKVQKYRVVLDSPYMIYYPRVSSATINRPNSAAFFSESSSNSSKQALLHAVCHLHGRVDRLM